MVAPDYWTSIAALRDLSSPPTLRQVQEEIARTPRLLMALNPDALKGMVGLAMTREELVIHTAGGLQITNAADVKDDAVIYIAGNEPSDRTPELPRLPPRGAPLTVQPSPSHFPTTHWTRVFLRRIRHPR